MSFEIDLKDWSHSHCRIQYGYVPWDSEIFGFPFYQLYFSDEIRGLSESLQGLLQFLVEETSGKCLVFTKIPSWEVCLMQILTKEGFYIVETMVEPRRELKSFRVNRRFERLHLRPAQIEDKPRLLKIAHHAFLVDRYHLDPNLPNDRASHRYQYWLDNGIRSGNSVFVYEDSINKKLLGFCYIKEVSNEIVDLSLAAIDPAVQKMGFGVMMYTACLEECQKRGYTQVLTHISLSNVAVLNIYVYLKFSFHDPKLTLHWYSGSSIR